MCCFEDALSNCMPTLPKGMPMDWLDPYGDMPLSGGMEAKVDIQVTETTDGIHVTSVKTPPRTGNIRLSEVIESIMGSMFCKPECKDDTQKEESDSKKEELNPKKQEPDPNKKNQDSENKPNKNASQDFPDRQSDKTASDPKQTFS